MISVILPTFNRRDRLGEAIDSVLAQTFRDLELIVVDDGSGDHSAQAVSRFHDRRLHYVFQHHRGVSAARNTGVRLAQGSWISFLDSDDRWQKRKLQYQLEALEESPEYCIVFTDEIWIRRGRRVNPRKIHRKHGGWIFRHALQRCIVSPSSVLLHRSILEQYGGFDESYPVCEDYELWLRLSCRLPFLFLARPLIVKVGGHPDQLSSSLWGLDRYRLRALLKTLRHSPLTPQQRFWTRQEIVRKATILASGFAHHAKQEEAEHYHRIAREYSLSSTAP